ncbi:MAG: sugar ABC transporter ATP-binding protein, partial [Clostridia bacterium]
EHKKGLFIDRRYYDKKTKELLEMVKLNVAPQTMARYLSTAQKQMIEILRAVACECKIVVMDEPTSSLTQKETRILFDIIRSLKARGVGIIYISHRMEEILELADNVIVLRDGRLVGEMGREAMTENRIVEMMVGRELNEIFAKYPAKIGDVVMEGKHLSVGYVKDVNFAVRSGEILGFSGLVGAGRSEVMRLVFGVDKKDGGEVFLNGQRVEIRCPADAIEAGIALVPEDRKEQALILGMSIKQNITLPILQKMKKGLFYDKSGEDSLAREYVQKLRVATPSINQAVKNLSGGNQQKVVLSKWLASTPKVLILDEPTRGLDVGAKQEIHELMSDLAGQGVAIIM